MAQKLRFPFKRGIILCGYKTAKYRSIWGYDHYGLDISTIQGYAKPQADSTVYASGEGTVVVCEYDKPTNGAKSLGYCIAIRYDGCESHNGQVKDLVLRYMHCDTTFVKLGDKVHLGTPISKENKIGTEDYHLHLEADTDTKYPKYSPQVSKGHSGWLHGTDSSVDLADYLWVDDTFKADKYSWKDRSYIREKDDNLPKAIDAAAPVKAEDTADYWKAKYLDLVGKIETLLKSMQ